MLPLQILKSRPVNGVQAVAVGAIAAILGIGIVRAMIVGTTASPERIWLVVGLFVVSAGCACYYAWQSVSRNVQVTFVAEGFRDARAGNVLVPWSDVRAAEYVSAFGQGAALVVFHLNSMPSDDIGYDMMSSSGRFDLPMADNRRVQVEVASLALSHQDFLRAVSRFAPHVEIRGSKRTQRGQGE